METSTAGAARSAPVSFASATACGETEGLQHECDIGMAAELHMLAIFTQQACSAAVMLCPGITHAARGCPKSIKATAIAAIWVARFISPKNFWFYILHSNDVGGSIFPL